LPPLHLHDAVQIGHFMMPRASKGQVRHTLPRPSRRPSRQPRQWALSVAIYAAVCGSMIAAFALTCGPWLLDSRTLDGATVWAKPLKFELALALHAGTLAIVAARLSLRHRAGPVMRVVALAFLVACIIEMGWIIGQAAQGQHSHFNDSSAAHRAMFSVMAFCAVIITGAAGAVAVAVWRDPDYGAPRLVKMGIVVGLLGGTILTLITAFAIGGHGSPYVGAVPDLASRMPLTGWSLVGGDLRVAHFLATHMMQAVPVAALVMCRILPGRMALPAVVGGAGIWSVWVMSAFGMALAGQTPAVLTLLFGTVP